MHESGIESDSQVSVIAINCGLSEPARTDNSSILLMMRLVLVNNKLGIDIALDGNLL